MSVTVQALLDDAGLPRAEALSLLAHASQATRERLIAGARDTVDDRIAHAFRGLATRRRAGEPIAYLIGLREFYGRSFAVDPRVLIPRPETELLVDLALARIDAGSTARVLDLGTGSGAIAITLALERPQVQVVATDRSADTLALARENARRLEARVAFVGGDWFDALDDDTVFDLIVANPPYIATDDPHLAQGDLRFEPAGALTDGADGLAAIRRIVRGAPSRLTADGTLMIEHGHRQAAAVRALYADVSLSAVTSHRDLAGIERITVGSRARSRSDRSR
jgi:release factor glutamine methyltransferase